jgi:hypothetical protein
LDDLVAGGSVLLMFLKALRPAIDPTFGVTVENLPENPKFAG